ncbi:gamma-glutamyltransferase family protein [Paenibacillus sp. IB182496]|uniref:Gamma-glutamyltransferase family protein n=1 Tax=Paenibacillus sabuli TaxID=2772509 RepID=A0A927BRX0_9BACL|nr:gamma-glutamyltransferase family protein [Paenibacillus sabuli]MBD2844343.1 gamma-glutamyltransferase family protein [Paenibacillus sabuli]
MTHYDTQYYPYPSRRTAVYAKRGMVATSQHLAAQAGLEMLKQGGNAVDAAIATAACLTVVEPSSNGIGGDAFALVWMKDRLHGLNSSGPAPQGLSLEALREQGLTEMPMYGWTPVTVPGAPAAWAELARRFARLPLTTLLAPAIAYAEEGYAVSPTTSRSWQTAFAEYRAAVQGEQYQSWFETFAPQGRAPAPGEWWRSPGHAATLRSIAETGGESFYRGELAGRIDAYSRQYGGYLRAEDLAAYTPEWVDPVSGSYRGYDVWELPPNGQGIVTLMALNILQQREDGGGNSGLEDELVDARTHRELEAIKLAFEDGLWSITDPRHMDEARVAELLSAAYASRQAARIGDQALLPHTGKPPGGGTVYLATADGEGNMVSYIQSNYMEFGSGLVVPGTGIGLHNRGHTFSLDPNHPNALAPGKRTYHTIIPGFLSRGGRAIGPFGVMGAFMQPQGHLQVLRQMLDYGLNPQAALDAPRWKWEQGRKVLIEPSFPEQLAQALRDRGHELEVAHNSGLFGRGQIIWRDEDSGVLCAGTDPRCDGVAASW